MAYYTAMLLLLLPLVFLIVAFPWSHIHCEGRLNSNAIVGTQEERLRATDPSGSELADVITVRPFLQSVVNFWNSRAPGDYKQHHKLDQGNELDLEVPKESLDISGATRAYDSVHQESTLTRPVWRQEQEDDGEPRLRMPQEKKSKVSTCTTGNYIDDCWRCDANWQNRRQVLASCAIGFGRSAQGGNGGRFYVVNTSSDDVRNPKPGTLRYGVTLSEALWITFASSMKIQLKSQLRLTSHKTIDGRGANVHLVGPSQITIEGISNVIIHGIHVYDIQRVEHQFEGDAIHILNSTNVWIDHCYLSRAYDGLIDVTKGSTSVTVSNCLFEHHSKVMLFGASPNDTEDRNMQVTVAFNKFGTNLTQRMPRCRYGNCHVANNFYTSGWILYAIGGSEDPTILSQANRFVAPNASDKKEVTQRLDDDGPTFGGWENWDWVSTGDSFANGAFFTGSGVQNASASNYAGARSFVPRHATWVQAMTADAGPLSCTPGTAC